jgi:hypothetical protein
MFELTVSRVAPLFLVPILAGCGGDPTADAGQGTARFTTWGEDYIEQGIPADPAGTSGFVDGWTLRYDAFLVSFSTITVAASDGTVGAVLAGSRVVDATRPGRKELATFEGLEARAWDRVSYRIEPARADATLVAADAAGLGAMVDGGYSVLVSGTARKGDGPGAVTRRFRWGFTTATEYVDCHADQGGRDTPGIVVTRGATDVSELTTHGDHFFYDRLQASPDPAVRTSLRWDAIAAADDPPTGDGDGEVTLEELARVPLDVTLYDPSGLDAPTLGAFVTSLARTIGHFRGEGECSIRRR